MITKIPSLVSNVRMALVTYPYCSIRGFRLWPLTYSRVVRGEGVTLIVVVRCCPEGDRVMAAFERRHEVVGRVHIEEEAHDAPPLSLTHLRAKRVSKSLNNYKTTTYNHYSIHTEPCSRNRLSSEHRELLYFTLQ